ncbi:ATP-dependent Clp protease proteolytic subunit [Lactobacillus equicursoris 66c]|uniref:ATP-dependent Clp protease proteolytic subunit n=1 Tax=Lactobacillus equicursoris 66c TaxID=872326 RepID=K0NDM6_9LACO|nr:head maturation protease, ClpP-related [Lactobacillus equicursoris]CCK82922.1 ATP-dependent Clp protease proteolytic subunit [Lactobacillus equicursoris 66c]
MEIDIYGDITPIIERDTDMSASRLRGLLKKNTGPIDLHINSGGGDVFEGLAIYNLLKASPNHITVYIDGLAASIASVIAMAGDRIYIPANAMLMVQAPWTSAQGNAKELRKLATDLDQLAESMKDIYIDRTGGRVNRQTITKLMDQETWLTGSEALEYGLADEVLNPVKVAACLTHEQAKMFKRVPEVVNYAR